VDIDQNAGITAERRLEPLAQFDHDGMAVRIDVYLPMQHDARTYAITPFRGGRAAMEVREHSAELQVGIGAGEKDMGQMIHSDAARWERTCAIRYYARPMTIAPAPDRFPAAAAKFLLPGPAGALEVATDVAQADATRAGTAIICHPNPVQGGTMTNKVVTTLERALRELGLATVRFNFRGVGASEGVFDNGAGETDDALAVAHWVQNVRPDDQLWLAGFSFGSYAATRVAGKLPVRQLITVAPAVTKWNFRTLPVPACPWLVIQGEADEVVEPQSVYDFVAATSPRPDLVRFPDTGHFFHGKLIELRTVVQEHVRANLPPPDNATA
jgi:alpha/beta superfamily hydrolase